MKPKDIFSLAVRILGLIFLYHGLLALPSVVPLIFAGPPVGTFIGGILMVVWPLLVARWLLSGAPLVMRLAFPDKDSDDKPAA
jgi:hypothetical protein